MLCCGVFNCYHATMHMKLIKQQRRGDGPPREPRPLDPVLRRSVVAPYRARDYIVPTTDTLLMCTVPAMCCCYGRGDWTE